MLASMQQFFIWGEGRVMAKRRGRYDWLPANIHLPVDDNWTHEVYADCDFDDMVSVANSFDGDKVEDWRIELYGLIDQISLRATSDFSLLDEAIDVIGRHMRVFPRISMGMPLAVLGLDRLIGQRDEVINQKMVDHANGWDVERQIEFYRRFKPDTRNEEDRVLAERVNLLEAQEKYRFKPKFHIEKSSVFDNVPAFLHTHPE